MLFLVGARGDSQPKNSANTLKNTIGKLRLKFQSGLYGKSQIQSGLYVGPYLRSKIFPAINKNQIRILKSKNQNLLDLQI